MFDQVRVARRVATVPETTHFLLFEKNREMFFKEIDQFLGTKQFSDESKN